MPDNDKKYIADWRDEFGNRRRKKFKSVTAKNNFLKKEVAYVVESRSGIKPKRLLFSNYAEEWLKKKKIECQSREKMKTYEWYKDTLENHINPLLGHYNLLEITPALLRGSLNQSASAEKMGIKEKLFSRGLSAPSVRGYMATLGVILRSAYKDELTKRDLASFLEKPPVTEHIRSLENKRPLTKDEVREFFKRCPSDYSLFYAICFFSGMRTGEAIALQRGDINKDSMKIFVGRAISNYKNTTTKIGKSRTVDITPHLKPFIDEYLKQDIDRDARLFPHYNISNLRNRIWLPILTDMKTSYRKPYVTRHTFASLMLAEGQPPNWVANQMGDNLETVLRNYHQYLPTDYKTDLMKPVFDGHFLDTRKEAKNEPLISM